MITIVDDHDMMIMTMKDDRRSYDTLELRSWTLLSAGETFVSCAFEFIKSSYSRSFLITKEGARGLLISREGRSVVKFELFPFSFGEISLSDFLYLITVMVMMVVVVMNMLIL
jgi:hypothetical protein